VDFDVQAAVAFAARNSATPRAIERSSPRDRKEKSPSEASTRTARVDPDGSTRRTCRRRSRTPRHLVAGSRRSHRPVRPRGFVVIRAHHLEPAQRPASFVAWRGCGRKLAGPVSSPRPRTGCRAGALRRARSAEVCAAVRRDPGMRQFAVAHRRRSAAGSPLTTGSGTPVSASARAAPACDAMRAWPNGRRWLSARSGRLG